MDPRLREDHGGGATFATSSFKGVAKGLKPRIIPLSVIPAKAEIHLKPRIPTFGRITISGVFRPFAPLAGVSCGKIWSTMMFHND